MAERSWGFKSPSSHHPNQFFPHHHVNSVRPRKVLKNSFCCFLGFSRRRKSPSLLRSLCRSRRLSEGFSACGWLKLRIDSDFFRRIVPFSVNFG